MFIKLTKAQTKSLASGVRRPKYKTREVRTVKSEIENKEPLINKKSKIL